MLEYLEQLLDGMGRGGTIDGTGAAVCQCNPRGTQYAGGVDC
eukprot:SAG31_NODE_1413_length_8459_cov_7.720215_12_plen_42_part_00